MTHAIISRLGLLPRERAVRVLSPAGGARGSDIPRRTHSSAIRWRADEPPESRLLLSAVQRAQRQAHGRNRSRHGAFDAAVPSETRCMVEALYLERRSSPSDRPYGSRARHGGRPRHEHVGPARTALHLVEPPSRHSAVRIGLVLRITRHPLRTPSPADDASAAPPSGPPPPAARRR